MRQKIMAALAAPAAPPLPKSASDTRNRGTRRLMVVSHGCERTYPLRRKYLAHDIVEDLFDDGTEECVAAHLPGVEVNAGQLGVVVQHALKVGCTTQYVLVLSDSPACASTCELMLDGKLRQRYYYPVRMEDQPCAAIDATGPLRIPVLHQRQVEPVLDGQRATTPEAATKGIVPTYK